MFCRLLLAGAATLALASCAGVDPSVLKKPAVAQTIELTSDLKWNHPSGLFRYELVAGTYVAELEDDNGTYFRGPEGCVVAENQATGRTFAHTCGIYVPRDPAGKATVYRFEGKYAEKTPAISAQQSTSAAAAGGALGPTFLPNQPFVGAAGGVVGGILVDAIIAAEQGRLIVADPLFQPGPGVLQKQIQPARR